MSTETNRYKLTTDQKLARLAAAVATLATEMDMRDDELEAAGYRRNPESRMSAEEQVERLLYVEHFTWSVVPKGGVW